MGKYPLQLGKFIVVGHLKLVSLFFAFVFSSLQAVVPRCPMFEEILPVPLLQGHLLIDVLTAKYAVTPCTLLKP